MWSRLVPLVRDRCYVRQLYYLVRRTATVSNISEVKYGQQIEVLLPWRHHLVAYRDGVDRSSSHFPSLLRAPAVRSAKDSLT